MTTPDSHYWAQRYADGNTGWDIGYPSTPLRRYMDRLPDKDLRILIPGCGNAWEAAYLHQQGFRHVTILDIATAPLEAFRRQHPGYPPEHIVHGDFFAHTGTYDLVLEQTFFCAIAPALRTAYAVKMTELLTPGGILAGVLFNTTFEKPGPPFGGDLEEYRALFSNYFTIKTLEPETASIPPRAGTEVFIEGIRP